MKKIISLFLIYLILIFSNHSYANEKIIPEAPKPVLGEISVGEAISPMRKGQLAPFTGVLLSPAAIAKVMTEINSISETIQIEVEKSKKEELVKCDYKIQSAILPLKSDVKILNASLEEKKKRIDELNKVVKEQSENQTDTTLWVTLGIGGGFLLGALTTVLVTYGVSQSTK